MVINKSGDGYSELEAIINKLEGHALFLDGGLDFYLTRSRLYPTKDRLLSDPDRKITGREIWPIRVITSTSWLPRSINDAIKTLYDNGPKIFNDRNEILYVFNAENLKENNPRNSVVLIPPKITYFLTNGKGNYLLDSVTIDLLNDQQHLNALSYLFDLMRYLNSLNDTYPTLAFNRMNKKDLNFPPPSEREPYPGMINTPLALFV